MALATDILYPFKECSAPAVGMETGEILDSQMTASTGVTSRARLNGHTAWCPVYPNDVTPHIQVTIQN